MSAIPVMKVTMKSNGSKVVINKCDYNADLHILRDAPKTDTSKTDTSKTDTSKTDTSKTDEKLGMLLRQAVLELDPDDDNHWTKEGLPMMEIVEDFLGYDVTRKELEVVASDVTRETIEGIVNAESNS